jgi:N-dimethylarginine dimethylaminohydrolase
MNHACNPRFLMCPPEHFGVVYAINPWMDPAGWARDDRALAAESRREWNALHRALQSLGAKVELVRPAPGLPDMVFTANAAVVLDRTALLARFRHAERQREEPHFEAAFRSLQARGFVDSVRTMPKDVVLEGAGDCVWDKARNLFWMGYGQRSDAQARAVVEATFGVDVVVLELADPRFYHMDTALCPLPGGELLFVPQAFTAEGLATIHAHTEPHERIAVPIEDACRLAANAVCIGNTLVMSGCSGRLRAALEERAFNVVASPLGAFLRSGGSAFCLTLRLDRTSAAMRLDRPQPAVA